MLYQISAFFEIVMFYLWTRCRRTEASDFTWKDIDWENGLLYLGQSDSQTKLYDKFQTSTVGRSARGIVERQG